MFDLDAGKLLVFGIVALAVIPPKDLPRVLRTVGQYVGRMRRMASEFQGQFMDAMKEAEKAAELDSVKQEFASLGEAARIDASFDPAMAMREDATRVIEPPTPVATSEIAVDGVTPPEPLLYEVVVEAPHLSETPPTEPHAPSAAS
jgi:sec-independent protein translocase protein TatB